MNSQTSLSHKRATSARRNSMTAAAAAAASAYEKGQTQPPSSSSRYDYEYRSPRHSNISEETETETALEEGTEVCIASNLQKAQILPPSTAMTAPNSSPTHTASQSVVPAVCAPTMVSGITYQGLELVFSTISQQAIAVIASRTRTVLQTLEVNYELAGSIVAMDVNAVSGMVLVAGEKGVVCTFVPVAAFPRRGVQSGGETGKRDKRDNGNNNTTGSGYNDADEDGQEVVSVFGKLRWIPGRILSCWRYLEDHEDLSAGRVRVSLGVSAGVGDNRGGVRFVRRPCGAHVHRNAHVHADDVHADVTASTETGVPNIISTPDKPSSSYKKKKQKQKKNAKQKSAVNQNQSQLSDEKLAKMERAAQRERRQYVSISSSSDHKVLVSHGDQLAVFDAAPLPPKLKSKSKPKQSPTQSNHLHSSSIPSEAQLIWTYRMNATILHAKISGDGRAIAFVLDGEGDGVPYPFGVRTFIRDCDDGAGILPIPIKRQVSDSAAAGLPPKPLNKPSALRRKSSYPTATTNASSASSNSSSPSRKQNATWTGGVPLPPVPTQTLWLYDRGETDEDGGADYDKDHFLRARSNSSGSIPSTPEMDRMYDYNPNFINNNNINNNNAGILYKQGPFLVHSTTVTRISFRGLGNVNSTVVDPNSHTRTEDQEGNDLLLTCCASDGSMRVFAQGNWKQMLHWETPPGSRADWIRGAANCNLGDLDPSPKQSEKRRVSTTSISGNGSGNNHGNYNGSAYANSPNTSAAPTRSSSPPSQMEDSLSDTNHSAGINRYLLQSSPRHTNHHTTTSTPNPAVNTSNNNSSVHTLPSHPIPTTAAGAWISELTFRGPFPALRLSRLSFLKSNGDDAAPAHIESVGAILPPGTIHPSAVLSPNSGTGGWEDSTLSVQGIWPAWDPWEPNPHANGEAEKDESLSGSAMALLGAVPNSIGANAGTIPSLDAAALGGTHSPPSELRVVASHPFGCKVAIMEFPLWGDRDFGAMELGSPLRYLLNLQEEVPSTVTLTANQTNAVLAPLPVTISTRCACLDFESNRLCANVSDDRQSVSLTWRKQGTMNIVARPKQPHHLDDTTATMSTSTTTVSPPLSRSLSLTSVDSIASTASVDSAESHSSFLTQDEQENEIERFNDWSAIPLPLSLPSLHLPSNGGSGNREKISLLQWWPDENFGGPPRLFALTTSGTLILYEMPPPWSALEPTMNAYDPFAASATSSLPGQSYDQDGDGHEDHDSDEEESLLDGENIHEYVANVVPHPDFGLGLRLESQAEGMPAVAGSYKKHPLSGGRLPAEKTGMIVLGDELLSVNDVSLEGMSFEDIIATVRVIGAGTDGGPLRMKFRSSGRKMSTFGALSNSSPATASASNRSRTSSGCYSGGGGVAERRTLEQMLGVKSNHNSSKREEDYEDEDENDELESHAATVLVGADAEIQQEFGRIVAIVREALPSYSTSSRDAGNKSPRSLVLLPWHYGKGAPVPYKIRGAALLVSGVGRTVSASRFEVLNGQDPQNCARFFPLGSIDLGVADDNDADGRSADIQSLTVVKTGTDGWCVAACDGRGIVTLVFINVADEIKDESEDGSEGDYETLRDTVAAADSSHIKATFRQHAILRCVDVSEGSSRKGNDDDDDDDDEKMEFLVRAPSIELLATMPIGIDGCASVAVWSSMPAVQKTKAGQDKKEVDDVKRKAWNDYSKTIITHRGDAGNDREEPILDFRWAASGSVDAFPWLLTFGRRSVIVHRRPGGQLHWVPIAEFFYPSIQSTSIPGGMKTSSSQNYVGSLSPADAFPHLIPALRTVVSATDERKYLKSDWHPESILASICTEREGAKVALNRNVKELYKWLSQWMSSDEANWPSWDARSRLACVPFGSAHNEDAITGDKDDNKKDTATDSAAGLMAYLTISPQHPNKPQSQEETLLQNLQSALCPAHDSPSKEIRLEQFSRKKVSKEFILAMAAGSSGNSAVEKSRSLPEPLKYLSKDELRFLWAMGELLHDPPIFKNLDAQAQLTSFSLSLIRHIERSDDDNSKEKESSSISPQSPYSSIPASPQRMFLTKQASSKLLSSTSKPKPSTISSGACLSALVSDTQSALIRACRKPNEKMTWEVARAVHLPFWLRSNDELKKVSEEIAQDIYKKTKDIMECALFYVATGNIKMLTTMAATDKNVSGRKFYSFLSGHDFSSPRGRSAAEKNAYSLLRKRRYRVAASFFLLAQPPMLQNALEIIATQLEDFSLAFFIARLVESFSTQRQLGGLSDGLTIGGGFNLRSMGGGGGFASTSLAIQEDSVEVNESKYEDWEPSLSDPCRNLLNVRGLISTSKDACFQAVQLLWLNRRNDAALCLSGRSFSNHRDYTDKVGDEIIPMPFDERPAELDSRQSPSSHEVISKSNTLIDFASRPIILCKMSVGKHIEWTSALVVSRVLSRRGIELPSIITLLQAADPTAMNVENENNHEEKLAQQNSAPLTGFSSSNQWMKPSVQASAPSSIFDSFDVPKPETSTTSANGISHSSAFDSFDVVPHKRAAQPTQSKSKTEGMNSSIFDAFDAPPPKATSAAKFNAGGMTSSIFDSFDTPPPRTKPTPTQNVTIAENMTSSIFDSFDQAPTTTRSQTSNNAPPIAYDASDVNSGSEKPNPLSNKNSASNASISSKNQIFLDEPDDSVILHYPLPTVWIEWRENLLSMTVARRLLREMARIIAPFQGDGVTAPMKLFQRHVHPLIPHRASIVLHDNCEGGGIITSILECLDGLCSMCKLSHDPVIEQALLLLACPSQPQRIVFAVLLHCLTGRADLAEDVMRDAAHDQMQRCEVFTVSNDDLIYNRRTKHHISSQYIRRQASAISWQLELCLWLHRGGTFPMSGLALKETIIAVRIGLVVSSWGRCHEILENVLKCEPDCKMNFEAGRQLWSSMKLISSFYDEKEEVGVTGGTTSGGWEFLVDCRREEATDMLRNRRPGSFLLRPHADDHGVFTLSFRTNLVPTVDKKDNGNSEENNSTAISLSNPSRIVKRDDVVQHAIVRLSDAGFRCGSFGPFSSLLKLLEAVSTSLPFDLLFHEPPVQGIIKEEGSQPSANSVFIRKLALHSKTEHYRWNASTRFATSGDDGEVEGNTVSAMDSKNVEGQHNLDDYDGIETSKRLGMFSQLLTLTEIRKQISAVASAEYEDPPSLDENWCDDDIESQERLEGNTFIPSGNSQLDYDFEGSFADSIDEVGEEEMAAIASRMIRPLLNWCRALETSVVPDIIPPLSAVSQRPPSSIPVSVAVSETGFEAVPSEIGNCSDGGDAVIRRMIQPRSGVEFRTLRVGEGGHSAVVVLFSKSEAISWIVSSGVEKDEEEAARRLEVMEKRRVIEQMDLNDLAIGKSYAIPTAFDGNHGSDSSKEIRYRFVDPWEVEEIESKDGELRGASLGREHYVSFTIGSVARACEKSQRYLGGLHLLALWSAAKGGISLTKALASAHPPWERDAGGDLQVQNGVFAQPSPYENNFRQHLYRNALFRRLNLPQRFLALIQVELLDLKNLTSPGGSSSLTAYALLRLKRTASNAPLTHKARTLDSACTEPRKIGKSSGPNAPASWGSIVRFRFPLPEDVDCDGVSYDCDREALFKGPPCVLQMSVYEKKFMTDVGLGGADVKLDALASGGQLEEWVPLRSARDGITWFARIRLTLRFELMCLETENDGSKERLEEMCPSVGMRKIRLLSRIGGAHEDCKGFKKSVSTPDFVAYLESMVY